jgi:hypothetical protein
MPLRELSKESSINIDHSIILATGKGRVVNGQSEFIFYEIKIPIRMGATVLEY